MQSVQSAYVFVPHVEGNAADQAVYLSPMAVFTKGLLCNT